MQRYMFSVLEKEALISQNHRLQLGLFLQVLSHKNEMIASGLLLVEEVQTSVLACVVLTVSPLTCRQGIMGKRKR